MNKNKFKKMARTAAICCAITALSAAPAVSFASTSTESMINSTNNKYFRPSAVTGSATLVRPPLNQSCGGMLFTPDVPENNGSNSSSGWNSNGSTNTPENNGSADSDNVGGDSAVSSYSSEVFSLINSERASNGLSALSYSAEAAAVAQAKAEDMAANNYFSHTSPTYGSAFDMLKSAGISYSSAGENIAKGQKSPSAVMNSWMNSSGHRANILSSSYGLVGVGCAADSSGTLYWVQVFIG